MKKIIALSVLFAPVATFAQIGQPIQDVSSLTRWISSALQTATVLILAGAVVFFLWNVFGYVMAGANEDERKKKQSGIIYGIIGIAVMLSVWGLVNFVTKSVGLDPTQRSAPSIIVPTI